ncbi:hypothetical protein [Stutzerimonas xanthomarina]|uniref:hypothetical protein n=1 Tax=Stutzerimonas xanthomarina TaxID=271420 RepID=UPI003AA7D0DC
MMMSVVIASSSASPVLKAKAPLSRTARSGGRRRWIPSWRAGQIEAEAQRAWLQSPTGPIVREVAIGETITVGDLAQQMSVKAAEVISSCSRWALR